MFTAAMILALPFWGQETSPSQHFYFYRYGCCTGNQHCQSCRRDAWLGPKYDYRRYFDYPWNPPRHRPRIDYYSPSLVPADWLPKPPPLNPKIPPELPIKNLPPLLKIPSNGAR